MQKRIVAQNLLFDAKGQNKNRLRQNNLTVSSNV